MKKIEELAPVNYKNSLIQRKLELEKLILIKQKELEELKVFENSGHIRISSHYNKAQFYLITTKGDKKGKYLPKKQNDFALSLIKYNYLKKVVNSIKSELTLLNKLILFYDHKSIEAINKTSSPLKLSIINTLTLTNEKYRNKWEKITYKSNSFDFGNTNYFTQNNEQVRSKSEVIIANLLKQHDVPYKYEYPFIDKGKTITLYPDFCCLNLRTRKEIYWEHFGLMDDEDYAKKAFHKIKLYTENNLFPGSEIIYTFETASMPLNIHEVETFILKYLK